jgi:hypothetical protein
LKNILKVDFPTEDFDTQMAFLLGKLAISLLLKNNQWLSIHLFEVMEVTENRIENEIITINESEITVTKELMKTQMNL